MRTSTNECVTLDVQEYMIALKHFFSAHADPNNAEPMKQYMRNQFEFIGIKTPDRVQLTKKFTKDYGCPAVSDLGQVIKELWYLPEREYQYIALFLMEKQLRHLTEAGIELLEFLVVTKSWWDTVDYIAADLFASFFINYPELIVPSTNRWMATENMWLQRTAVLFQLKYKMNTDENLLFSCIERCMESKEFFIQKAIGWALREYAKTKPDLVIQFVESHNLAALSRREALKHLKKLG